MHKKGCHSYTKLWKIGPFIYFQGAIRAAYSYGSYRPSPPPSPYRGQSKQILSSTVPFHSGCYKVQINENQFKFRVSCLIISKLLQEEQR